MWLASSDPRFNTVATVGIGIVVDGKVVVKDEFAVHGAAVGPQDKSDQNEKVKYGRRHRKSGHFSMYLCKRAFITNLIVNDKSACFTSFFF